MTTLVIRGIDPETYARLRAEAARHGRPAEAEARFILQEKLMAGAGAGAGGGGLGSRIRARFQGFEGDMEIPGRNGELPRGAGFGS